MAYKRRRKKKVGCATIVVTLVVAVVVAAVGYFGGFFGGDKAPTVVDGEVMFHFIDVGQADAALICTAEGNVLIDAGTNAAEDDLKAYLDSKGIKDIEYAIFTHPHEDHIGGADMIMNNYNVKNVIMPEKEQDSQTYTKMIDAIEESNANVIFSKVDATYNVGDLKMTILAPIDDSYSELNDYSVVVRVDFGGTSALFTGDAEALSEEEMLSRHALSGKLDCDLLKVGHHGSESSSTRAFLEKVSPDMAVISCGEDNKYGHPNRKTIDSLNALQIPYYRTDLEGSILIKSDGETLTKQ